ncbi:WD40 repeat-like protein [Westerdykella ornata]|uniref:Elongator complex protein 2 n=1 Tax=Westerdykella ornata TaxID=318751 RepID=A0A6A6JRT4_WESOR|nr:WD40 repeat-like protein [Westerdykella ornata]KAF2278578.1 WD40 repeat-like protein [Westerdykella ornata]
MDISSEYISIGGNRNPAAAAWDVEGGSFLAFGADNAIALWDPLEESLRGVRLLLNGHKKSVNAVTFFPTGSKDTSIILSGSADHTLRIWRGQMEPVLSFDLVKTITEHQGPITRIATLPGCDIFVTGASDGTVKIWKLLHDASFSELDVQLLQTITLTPKYFPLAVALTSLDASTLLLAVAGTRSIIQIFTSSSTFQDTSPDINFALCATLTGHEGWIRALDFVRESTSQDSDLLLASASQDKYIRLWRVHKGAELPAASSALNDPALGVLGRSSLSNKAHRFETVAGDKYSITFEALLLGHEDWIYTASWRRHASGKLQLLSTSEDNSLAIWEADPDSGVWVCITRLGEISAQKGSTTATGSAGGFWIGLWAPDGRSVVSLGRTGSWRKWTFSAEKDMWEQQVAITGHVREVRGVCWSRDGSYLLSTGSDQTTRLFAEWKHDAHSSWHEFSRPQIHGYDLNCIDSITDSQFISGADEKLLRVFDEPKAVAMLLQNLCGIQRSTTTEELPDAANIPVLGLSNKAIQAVDDNADNQADGTNAEDEGEDATTPDPSATIRKSTLALSHPPLEDHLARHLLWPETEKLYGHGYEISAVATSPDGTLIATACRASSIDHAVIRLYNTKEWLEVKPALKAHSLTVTGLQFSPDGSYLLSVGRDRQWVVWERNQDGAFVLKFSNPKGHSRMILGCSWASSSQGSGLKFPTFLTAGRDKTVKIWQIAEDGEVKLRATVTAKAAVTAVQCNVFAPSGGLVFAYGTDDGEIGIGRADAEKVEDLQVTLVDAKISPARTVNQLAWRPKRQEKNESGTCELAVASDDSSVRIYTVSES